MNNGLCDRFCPPLMQDGRFVTDYRSSSYVNHLILQNNGLRSSYDMKKFLQDNAVKLQNINRQFFECKNKNAHCTDYYLPDPNRQIEYWDAYSKQIGYQNSMTFCGVGVDPTNG